MAFAVIAADNSWVDGPVDAAPTPAAGQRVVEVALGYPATCRWDAAAGGFVDLAPIETPVAVVQLYTPAELAALWTLAASDGRIAGLLLAAAGSPRIDLAGAPFVTGVALAQAAGVLTADRAARIRAGLLPAL